MNTRPDRCSETSPQPTSLVTATAVPGTVRQAATRASSRASKASCHRVSGTSQVSSPSTTAVTQVPRQSTRTGAAAAQGGGDVVGLHGRPVRRPAVSVGRDPGRPLRVGRGVGNRAGGHVRHRRRVGEQPLGVAGLAGPYAAGDQGASRSHRR